LELHGITDTILQEAKETAEIILKEAQEFGDSILEKQRQIAIKDAETQRSLLLKKTANEAEVKRLRKLAKAKITANWIVLSKKEEIISAVLTEAKKRLQYMTKTEKYATVLESLITPFLSLILFSRVFPLPFFQKGGSELNQLHSV
jgi:vacuolar-type H+-ATPase subunit E/Vma4